MKTAFLHFAGQLDPLAVDVPETLAEYTTGLGHRDTMPAGMLFRGINSVTMEPMRFALDLIFLCDNQVVGIEHRAQPGPSTVRHNFATDVLEMPAGWAAAHQVQVGQHVYMR